MRKSLCQQLSIPIGKLCPPVDNSPAYGRCGQGRVGGQLSKNPQRARHRQTCTNRAAVDAITSLNWALYAPSTSGDHSDIKRGEEILADLPRSSEDDVVYKPQRKH